VLSGEATNTNFIVFGLIRPGIEPTISPAEMLFYMLIFVDLFGHYGHLQTPGTTMEPHSPEKDETYGQSGHDMISA
jgi:hypothetical protein